MSEQNKEIVRRAYAAINAHDVAAMGKVIAEDFIEHEEFPGLSPSLQFFAGMFEAFPDCQMSLDDPWMT